ncbi:MAG: hypothetical protein PHH31_08565, partial [Acidaminococcaceae bacterium]|nr:hypothetical protein [Acidaminococcaceae bacterium]
MRRDLENIQENRLFVGSGVDDLFDDSLHTELDDYGQYVVNYQTGKNDDIARIVLNSDESKNEDDLANLIFSQTPNI